MDVDDDLYKNNKLWQVFIELTVDEFDRVLQI